MKSQCLKISIRNRKVFLHITGMPVRDLLDRPSLVYEILKTLGKSQGLPDLMNPGDIYDLNVVEEYPDYFIVLKNGTISIMNPI
jgi:hypothetical protein